MSGVRMSYQADGLLILVCCLRWVSKFTYTGTTSISIKTFTIQTVTITTLSKIKFILSPSVSSIKTLNFKILNQVRAALNTRTQAPLHSQ
jgi:hypothetical protein